MEKDSGELDRLEERHREEVAREAGTHVRHTPRPLRFLRPAALPESDALRARLGAPAVFVDPLRSSGAWLATSDATPFCGVDAGAPFGGHAPLPLVRGYMEGDFGATLLGGGEEEASTALRARLHRLAPELPHVELFAGATDARVELASRLRARRPGPILVVGELPEVAALGPHRVLPSPPPRLDAPATLDELQAAALSALEHALDERPAAAVWIVALDVAGRALSDLFVEAAAEVAQARGVPCVVDEAALALGAAGRELASGAAAAVEARVLGGPALPGIVLARGPIALEQGVVEPAALVRARLLLDAHDPALAARAQAWLVTRLEALVGRFPDLVLAPRATGYVFAFELPTVGHLENLSAQLPLRGACLPAAPPGHPSTAWGRLGLTWTVAEVDRLFDALRGALKWLEAHVDAHGVGPAPSASDVPVGSPLERTPARAVETRVRVVTPEDADELLDAIVALEERVYEPARRDPREKLALAFHDPAGVVAVAEIREGDTWKVVGGALAAPLERIQGVAGCDDDPLRGDRVSLYSIGTTLDPECRGLGLGERMKAAVVEGASAIRRRDGSARFHWICGRMRVGATDAMARINRRLGASEVRRLRGQYEGSAEATYYRMPVRGFVPPGPRTSRQEELGAREPVLLHRPERWLGAPPEGLQAAAEVGLLFGPVVHGLQPGVDRASPSSLRALEVLRALHPSQPHVRLTASRRLALHACAEALQAEVLALVGDDVADLSARRLPHPADDPQAALDALARSPRSVLFLERVQARTGRVVPPAFLDALRARGARFVAVERATSGFRHPEPTVEGALALVWGEGPLGVVHARDPQPLGAAGDELTLVRASYALRAARALRLSGQPDERRLDEALAPAAALGVWRGEGLYRVLETPLAGQLVAHLRGYGFVLRARGDHLAFAPPLDLPDELYAELRAALRATVRSR